MSFQSAIGVQKLSQTVMFPSFITQIDADSLLIDNISKSTCRVFPLSCWSMIARWMWCTTIPWLFASAPDNRHHFQVCPCQAFVSGSNLLLNLLDFDHLLCFLFCDLTWLAGDEKDAELGQLGEWQLKQCHKCRPRAVPGSQSPGRILHFKSSVCSVETDRRRQIQRYSKCKQSVNKVYPCKHFGSQTVAVYSLYFRSAKWIETEVMNPMQCLDCYWRPSCSLPVN